MHNNKYANYFLGAANPFVGNKLNIDVRRAYNISLEQGASRSSFIPGEVISSSLLEQFAKYQRKIPEATFGLEFEMFLMGMSTQTSIGAEENEALQRLLQRPDYEFKNDITLVPDTPLSKPIEMVTPILCAMSEMQKLQNTLSILNDWGAHTNQTAGLHIHTGINQWRATMCLKTLEERLQNPHLDAWDRPQPGFVQITPMQLVVVKQFLINMAAVQDEFFVVSRASGYNAKNAPDDKSDRVEYNRQISRAENWNQLVTRAHINIKDSIISRDICVNLNAFPLYGTLEIRGFSKKNADHMEIDPNLPIRDIIFTQQMLVKTLKQVRRILLSGAAPGHELNLKPSKSLKKMADAYVQDTFVLQGIHALGQRAQGRRQRTMGMLVRDQAHMGAQTIEKIEQSASRYYASDPLAQHFVAVLKGQALWHPTTTHSVLPRAASLREMANGVT